MLNKYFPQERNVFFFKSFKRLQEFQLYKNITHEIF